MAVREPFRIASSYGSGLRVRGKRSKDRLVPIPPAMMPRLAECWRLQRNPVWLSPFVGRGGISARIRVNCLIC